MHGKGWLSEKVPEALREAGNVKFYCLTDSINSD